MLRWVCEEDRRARGRVEATSCMPCELLRYDLHHAECGQHCNRRPNYATLDNWWTLVGTEGSVSAPLLCIQVELLGKLLDLGHCGTYPVSAPDDTKSKGVCHTAHRPLKNLMTYSIRPLTRAHLAQNDNTQCRASAGFYRVSV